MKRRDLLILMVVAGMGGAFPGSAPAYCSTRERIQLRNEGVSPLEVDRLCGGAPLVTPLPTREGFQKAPRYRLAATCATNAGPCPMTMAMPVGAACSCYTQWGAVAGVAR